MDALTGVHNITKEVKKWHMETARAEVLAAIGKCIK